MKVQGASPTKEVVAVGVGLGSLTALAVALAVAVAAAVAEAVAAGAAFVDEVEGVDDIAVEAGVEDFVAVVEESDLCTQPQQLRILQSACAQHVCWIEHAGLLRGMQHVGVSAEYDADVNPSQYLIVILGAARVLKASSCPDSHNPRQ